MFPSINLGIVDIPLYSSLFIIAFFFSILIARKRGPHFGIDKSDVLYGAIYGGIGILIGSKVVYFLTKLPVLIQKWDIVVKSFEEDIWSTLIYIINFSFGGLVFYGGLIGAVIGVWRYCYRFRIPFVPYLDIFAPLIPFIHGVGRIGCFCAGCCYGVEYYGFGSIRFPKNSLVPGLGDVPRFPVQLLEAGMNFVLCAILFLISKKDTMKNGKLMGIYLIYYSIARFGLEMLRGDKIRGGISLFSTSQLISLLILPIGILLLSSKLIKKIDRVKRK